VLLALSSSILALGKTAVKHTRAERRTGVARKAVGSAIAGAAALHIGAGSSALASLDSSSSSSSIGVSTVGGILATLSSNPTPADRNFDFYRSSCVSELELAIAAADGIKLRSLELLLVFPGNDNLLRLVQAADRVLKMPLHSPLSDALSLLEAVVVCA